MGLIFIYFAQANAAGIYRIELDAPPQTTTECSLKPTTGSAVNVTFDAGDTNPSRLVVAPSSGSATVVCAAKNTDDAAWTAKTSGFTTAPTPQPPETTADVRKRFSAATLHAIAGQRSFGLDAAVPDLMKDTLQILAEFAKKKFDEGMVQVVQKKIEAVVCNDLNGKVLADAAGTDVALGHLVSGLGSGSLVPATCNLTKDAVLLDLINDPAPLERAIESDALHVGFAALRGGLTFAFHDTKAGVLPGEEAVGYVVNVLDGAVQDLVRSRLQVDASFAEGIVVELAHGPWDTAATTPTANKLLGATNTALCVADAGFAVATLCGEVDNCDVGTLASGLFSAAPILTLPAGGSCAASGATGLTGTALAGLRSQISQLATETVAMSNATDDAERRVAAVQLGFDVAQLVVAPIVESTNAQLPIADGLTAVETVVVAILQGDLRSTLSGAVTVVGLVLDTVEARLASTAPNAKLVSGVHRALDKVTPLISTLASNARLLEQAAEQPDQAEALKEARTQAITSLIEESTRRTSRGGDWVVSLGANPGVMATWNTSTGSVQKIPLSMPMGFALDFLPTAVENERGDTLAAGMFGWHTQLSILDLAQYLPVGDGDTDFTWQEILLFDFQTGMAFGAPNASVVVGSDLRYTPYTTGRQQEWSAGMFVAYYVPFFDFN